MDPNKINIIENRLESIGFTGPTAKTLAVALIQVAEQQGVHPISYFELNEDSIKLAEQTYKAINGALKSILETPLTITFLGIPSISTMIMSYLK